MLQPARRPLLALLVLLAGCSRDAADREYFAALEGEKTGRPCEELLPHVERAIVLRPDRVGYYEKRSGYRSALGDLAGARADLDKVIGLADRPYLRFVRATVLCKLGRPSEALPDLDSAIAAQPTNDQFYRVRAIARVGAGMSDRALEDGEWMVGHVPQNAESFYARGVALAGLGRAREAVADFDEVMRRRPELVYPLAARAEVYERLGDATRAQADRAELARRSQGEGGCRGCGVCVDPLHP